MTDKSDSERRGARLFTYLLILAVLGSVLTLPASFWLGEIANRNPLGIFSGLTLLHLAGLLAGGLLGLIFAVPRSLWGVGYQSPLSRKEEENEDEESRLYRPNSNLEEISDWLTKMLVGILLINVNKIGAALGQLATVLGNTLTSTFPATTSNPAVGTVDSAGLAGTIALTLLLFAVMLGFLWGYLWSRLHLPDLFTDADRIKQRLDALDGNQQALLLFENQLSGKKNATAEEVGKVLAKVNKTGQDTVYSQARRYLMTHLGSPGLLIRVLPLYKALAQNSGYPNNKLEFAAALAAVDPIANETEIFENLVGEYGVRPELVSRDSLGIWLAVLRTFAQRRPDDDLIRRSLQQPELLKAAQEDDVLKNWMKQYEPNLLRPEPSQGQAAFSATAASAGS